MPLIAKEPPTVKKEVLSVRIEPAVLELLRRYCEFIDSGQHYVVERALQYTFHKDREFQVWLRRNGTTGGEREAGHKAGSSVAS
ncbi:MAG: hypothetical protein GY953_10245 [bacterium]|nr:hypothetical protein [bacterium]